MPDYNKLEAQFAKRYGGVPVKNSGRGESKGDAIIEHLLVDFKFTDAKSYSLNIEAFKKHERSSYPTGLIPIVVPVFMQYNERAFGILDFDTLIDLLTRISDLEADLSDAKDQIEGLVTENGIKRT